MSNSVQIPSFLLRTNGIHKVQWMQHFTCLIPVAPKLFTYFLPTVPLFFCSPFWFYVFGHPVFRLRLPCRLRPHHMHNSEILSCMNYRQQLWTIIVSNYTRWQGYWCDSGYDGGNLTRLSNIRVIIMRQALYPIFIISCHAFVPKDY